MIRMYVHAKTVRYTDYGDLLSTEHGIAWSTDNETPMGFERDRTVAEVLAQATLPPFAGNVEVIEGKPIVRTFDMNPHGLI